MRFSRTVYSLLVVMPGVLGLAVNLSAQTKSTVSRLRELNNNVLRLHEQMHQASPEQAEAVRTEARSVISERASVLGALMEANPAEALPFTFSAELAGDLAMNFANAARNLESHASFTGPIERCVSDYADGSHREELRMQAGKRMINLSLANLHPGNLASGDLVTARGVLLGDTLVGTPLKVLQTAATIQNCSTTGVQKIAALLVAFPGVPLPTGVTTQSVSDILFGTTPGMSVDGFLREASYGQTSAAGSVFGTYTLGGTYTTCADVGGAVLNDAIAAATASGVNLNNYNRVLLIFPDIFGCGWSGYANVGGCTIDSTSGSLNASTAFVAARYMADRTQGVALSAHEIGHNMGLLHSGTVTAGTDVLGPVSSPGIQADMGDYWSVMGETVTGLYPAPQKAEVLGWMQPATHYQVVQSNSTYTLQPLETSPPGLQALKVQRGTGNNAWLWIEYRQPLGNYDSTLFPQPFSAALIHYEDSNTQLGHTYLANFNPGDAAAFSPGLAAGKTWTDPYTNLSITVLSATSTGLTVSVNYGAVPCARANPTLSMTPSNPSVSAGSAVSYTISVTNNDSSGCTATGYSLGSTEPAGWIGRLSASLLTLNPGQTSSVTLTETVPAGASTGTYSVTGAAGDSSYTGSAAANCSVVAAPALANVASITGATFSTRQTVPVTAKVSFGGSGAPGAVVKFTITKPGGATLSATVTADSTGKATWSYKIAQKDPAGTYTLTSVATYQSQTALSAPVNFTVR